MAWMSVLVIVGVALGCALASANLLHYFQLESYQFPGYFRTLKRNWIKAVLPGFIMTVCLCVWAIILVVLLPDDYSQSNNLMSFFDLRCILLASMMILTGYIVLRLFSNQKAKKPLVFTPRLKRLCVMVVIVYTAVFFLLSTVQLFYGKKSGSLLLINVLFPLFIPLWLALAGLLAWPIEKLISQLYFQDAKRILKSRADLIRIGITGSWGKTSVKFILGTLLQEKYNTLVTPASFNTPMGVTKIIRTVLEPGHKVFVAEMGARHMGDIREMCRLVNPTYGVLTSVGPQHLDTFHTLQRVKKTKYELMDAIPHEGACFFGDDEGICRELYVSTQKTKILAGTRKELDDVWAEDITVSSEGSSFWLCTKNDKIECTTQLLGELNIQNIALAASVCIYLGLTMKQIARGITKLKPVEHRLQLISRPGCMTVIDDAFNSNIRGAETAMHVLSGFSGKRIVVTPGMVELGNEESQLNRTLGKTIADCVDIAVLVGRKHTSPIVEGLNEKKFDQKNVYVVSNLNEAIDLLNQIAGPEDTVLFENDLPDNYNE